MSGKHVCKLFLALSTQQTKSWRASAGVTCQRFTVEFTLPLDIYKDFLDNKII